MEGKIILLRDQSEESEKAEKLLKRCKIDHATIFCSDGRLPSLLSPNSAYFFDGIGGIRLFIKGF